MQKLAGRAGHESRGGALRGAAEALRRWSRRLAGKGHWTNGFQSVTFRKCLISFLILNVFSPPLPLWWNLATLLDQLSAFAEEIFVL